MFWPYRPREGYPVTPRWLTILLLVVVSLGFVLIMEAVFGHDPTAANQPLP